MIRMSLLFFLTLILCLTLPSLTDSYVFCQGRLCSLCNYSSFFFRDLHFIITQYQVNTSYCCGPDGSGCCKYETTTRPSIIDPTTIKSTNSWNGSTIVVKSTSSDNTALCIYSNRSIEYKIECFYSLQKGYFV